MDALVNTRTGNTTTRLASLVALSLLLLLPACRRGQRAGEVTEEAMIAGGRASFQAYCASCHGREAKGNGPVAEKLTVAPPDLTRLATRHDGQFPRAYVMETIDGRAALMAHGNRAMPVWGKIWRSDTEDSHSEEEVERLINELLHYLESIQEAGAS